MRTLRLSIYLLALLGALVVSSFLLALVSNAQTRRRVRPDTRRALSARQERTVDSKRKGAYVPSSTLKAMVPRPRVDRFSGDSNRSARVATRLAGRAVNAISPGTPLSRILHTSQLNLTSEAGTLEQFWDSNDDLVADERTTFESEGGAFDVAVGESGARYEVFSVTENNTLKGFLVVALDTNGDFQMDTPIAFDLHRDFSLPSAAAVVTGRSASGREFVVVSSSGFFNSSNPNDPNNEPSPGLGLLVRDSTTGGFDDSSARELVRVGDNQLFNANALALLPNNDLLVADFNSNELRIVRDTNGDRMPDTLDPTPYYAYRFSDDNPLD
ncbi:MAG: hypothetical protein ACREBC_03025, partial [Pyrinomonadaceae bacterium]